MCYLFLSGAQEFRLYLHFVSHFEFQKLDQFAKYQVPKLKLFQYLSYFPMVCFLEELVHFDISNALLVDGIFHNEDHEIFSYNKSLSDHPSTPR